MDEIIGSKNEGSLLDQTVLREATCRMQESVDANSVIGGLIFVMQFVVCSLLGGDVAGSTRQSPKRKVSVMTKLVQNGFRVQQAISQIQVDERSE